METHKGSLEEIKADPLAHELATSEGTQPYAILGSALTSWFSALYKSFNSSTYSFFKLSFGIFPPENQFEFQLVQHE